MERHCLKTVKESPTDTQVSSLFKEDLQRFFHLFSEENPKPIYCLKGNGELIYSNQPGLALLEKFSWQDFFPSNSLKVFLEKKENRSVHVTIAHRVYEFTVVPIKDEDIAFLYGSDITQRKKTELQLKQLSWIIEKSINMVFITTYFGSIEYVNATFERITGYAKKEVLGKNPSLLASKETDPEVYKTMWSDIQSGQTWRGLLKNKKKNGDYYWANGFISPIRNETGEITHFLAIQEDITEKIAVEERLNYLSVHDRMTGLIGRVPFVNLLDSYIKETGGKDREAILLQLNIDGFQLINDSFGHCVGDQFLKSFADFLLHITKELNEVYGQGKEPIVGRIGGDEFGIFLDNKSREEGMKIAENIRNTVAGYRFIGGSIRVTVSIGLTFYPGQGKNSKELLSQANAATLQAKELGQNRSVLYNNDDIYLKQVQSILEEKRLILNAIEEDRIIPWFQPILDLDSNQVKHYESLARLLNSDGEIILPGSFIPTAERFGLISSIDGIITRKSIQYQGALQKKGKSISFSMNLSGKHLVDQSMLQFLEETLEESGADPEAIVFEITETAAIDNRNRAKDFITALKKRGCKFSLDDFGVGYTSFVHLLELDLDYIKIDGSFIRQLVVRKRDQVLVKTIVDMAKNLGVKTIGEFVDKKEIIPILKELGVDYAQGYYIGKPSPSLIH